MALTTDAELRPPAQGALNPLEPGSLEAPDNLTPVEPSSLEAPDNLTPVERDGIGAPDNLTPVERDGIGAPDNLTPSIREGIGAPNVLVPVAAEGAPYPLNHARIGYESGIQSANITATTGSATVGALSTVSTWERWQAASGGVQVLTATFSFARTVDYVALASFDLQGATVTVQYSPNLTLGFIDIMTLTPGADGALMALFDTVTARRVQLTITRAVPVSLGVWFMGNRLDMERPFYGGFKPPTLNRRTSYDNEISTAGQMLGRNINRQGIACSVSLSNLSSEWYRANFDPFVLHAMRKPFFMLWNPELYPNECIYGSVNDDIAPTNIGGRLKVSVSFDMEGYA